MQSVCTCLRGKQREEDDERKDGVNRVVKEERGGGERCVNAGGPHRSISAGSSSTEQQMRTDYTAVKKHMKGSGQTAPPTSHLPSEAINGFENNFMNSVVCLMV